RARAVTRAGAVAPSDAAAARIPVVTAPRGDRRRAPAGRVGTRGTSETVTPVDWRERLDALAAPRARAFASPIGPVRTVSDCAAPLALAPVVNAWSSTAFDGPFYQSSPAGRSSMGVVFVRSRDGNTGASDPATLGGGAVDLQLIYEGLSRVAADAVVVG